MLRVQLEAGKLRYHTMKAEVEKILEDNTEESLLLVGEFNGHNKNFGKMIIEWMERYKLTTYVE